MATRRSSRRSDGKGARAGAVTSSGGTAFGLVALILLVTVTLVTANPMILQSAVSKMTPSEQAEPPTTPPPSPKPAESEPEDSESGDGEPEEGESEKDGGGAAEAAEPVCTDLDGASVPCAPDDDEPPPAHKFAVEGNDALMAGDMAKARAALESAIGAEGWTVLPPSTRFFVHFNLGRLLAFEADGSIKRAEKHFGEALLINPDSWQIKSSLAEMRLDEGDFAGARIAIKAAMASLKPDEKPEDESEVQQKIEHVTQVAGVAHSIELGIVQAKRQGTDPFEKKKARAAWLNAMKLGQKYETPMFEHVTKWIEIADAHQEKNKQSGPGQCPLASLSIWDLDQWKKKRACQQIERTENLSLRVLMRSLDDTQPTVISGNYWPEFLDEPTLTPLLFESAENGEVIEVAVSLDDGSVAQLQPLAPWANVSTRVRQLAAEGEGEEATVLVRGSREYMLLQDFLRLNPAYLKHSLYLFNSNLNVYMPRIDAAIKAPRTLTFGPMQHKGTLAEVNLWAGYGATMSGLHFNTMHNLHHVVEGTKEILLFPPEDGDKMTSTHGIIEVTPGTNATNDNVGPDDSELAPGVSARRAHHVPVADVMQPSAQFREATAMRCLVSQGDTVFIPAGWYHDWLTTPSEKCRSTGINLFYEPERVGGGSLGVPGAAGPGRPDSLSYFDVRRMEQERAAKEDL
jgi:tetratricopeptide (TPR) repeat protein